MGTFRFVSIAFALFIVAYFGIQHLTAVQPLKPDARVPAFHKVDVNSPRFKMERSFASDNDATRDKLRQAVLESAKALGDEPCNSVLKASYIEAATAYARAWLSVAPCVGKRTCGAADERKLDLAQKAFGSPLDHRVREAMERLHGAGIFVTADFPKDAGFLYKRDVPERSFPEFAKVLAGRKEIGAACPPLKTERRLPTL